MNSPTLLVSLRSTNKIPQVHLAARWANCKKGDRHHHSPGFQSTLGAVRWSSVTVSVCRSKPYEGYWIEETEGSPQIVCVNDRVLDKSGAFRPE